ncbi:MAG: hypothetical protein HQK69_01165 [Desulfamplus sp.]|nr:hypothetical protein [Desulfamplus sp.]
MPGLRYFQAAIMVIVITIMGAFLMTKYSFAADTNSGQALDESGKAGAHASNSAAHAIISTGKVTSAASAIPLSIGGAAGAVSSEIANDLMDAATAPAGTPLEISDESVSVGPPPDEALKTNTETKVNTAKKTKSEPKSN